MFDVYCEKGKCPICEGSLNVDINFLSISCKSGCYFFQWHSLESDDASAFILLENKNDQKEYIIAPDSVNIKLIERIEYWRENDRYLMKMLGSDNNG